MPKLSSVSMGLGKATMRGIRRCPECGTFNGTKGNMCKNKSCNAVFKHSGKRKKSLLETCLPETCRLHTGTFTSVYSVRVRDKGPDFRGFVQLPVVQSSLGDSSDLLQSTALCFVDHCQGNFNTKVLQCHEQSSHQKTSVCQHISAALRCSQEAEPLPVNISVLEALPIDEKLKEEVWALSSERGPAVQRVSKNSMAVKCRVSSKFPLGYLHITFAAGKSNSDSPFFCPCSTFKESSRLVASEGRCAHFYSCICAFVNQDSLRQEFESYVRLEISLSFTGPDDEGTSAGSDDQKDGQEGPDLATLLNSHVEILQDSMSAILSDVGTDGAILSDVASDGTILEGSLEVEESFHVEDVDILSEPDTDNRVSTNDSGNPPVRDRNQVSFNVVNSDDPEDRSVNCQDHVSSILAGTIDVHGRCVFTEPLMGDTIVFSTDALDDQDSNFNLRPDTLNSLTLLNANQPDDRGDTFIQQDAGLPKLMPMCMEILPEQIPLKKKPGGSRPMLSFIEWLGTVTESINQHMHYQFPGRPNSLVFHTPTKFFDKLKERMYRSHRKRLHRSSTIFTRHDSVPVGTFMKYSWTLSSRFHVKAVFDTPHIPLRLVRSFVQNSDGTFRPADQNIADEVLTETLLYKTYLRVGIHRGEKEPALFKIEWIPDVLPVSHIGELRLEFEFGHVPEIS